MTQHFSLEELVREGSPATTLLDSVFDGVYIADRRRRILFWNKGAEAITGFSSAEVKGGWCGNNVLNHLDENGNLLCKRACPLVKAMATGQPCEMKVYPCHKSGHRFPTMTHVSPIRDETGKVIAAIEVFRDISKEEDLRILQEKFSALIAQYVSKATLDTVRNRLVHVDAERGILRDLTILYLDVAGFTRYSEHHSPRDVVGMLNEVFGTCQSIAAGHHGDIDKYIGDCIMAVFIDANDAVEAGRAMLGAMGAFNERRAGQGQTPVAIRIGINSGLVIQGEVGTAARKEVTVIGDVVNAAARIQHLAPVNGICISDATYSRLKNPAGLSCQGAVSVNGRVSPITLYTWK